MNIYLASRWSRQAELRLVRDQIQQNPNLRVVSTWIDTERPEVPDEKFFLSREGKTRLSTDLIDISRSHIVMADMTAGIGRRGGMMIEIGYAAGLSKPVVLIGNRADFGVFGNIFSVAYSDWQTAIENI